MKSLLHTSISFVFNHSSRFISKRFIHIHNSQYFIGQPHPKTHPHILKPNEITPKITKEEFAERRNRFFNRLPEKSVALIPSAPELWMSPDIPYLYRQDSNFLYLSGFQEPQSLLIFDRTISNSEPRFLMMVRPKDPKRQLWEGHRAGEENAVSFFGAHKAFTSANIESELKPILDRASKIFYSKDVNPALNELLYPYISKSIIDPGIYVSALRMIKSDAEIQLMKKSATIAAHSMIETIKITKPGMLEYQLAAKMEFECKYNGARRLSFPVVAASGNGALSLHYLNNDMPLKEGSLIMMDAGAEVDGYASDITRTWPVSGKFSDAQRALYELVLNINKNCIELVKPGSNILAIHRASTSMMREGLKKLGIWSENGPVKLSELYPHAIGHYLGMDTHDVAEVPGSIPLQPGMIVTIEPGVHVPYHESIPERFRGIGMRIEDDVLVTENGREVITHEVPKEPNEIETLMSR